MRIGLRGNMTTGSTDPLMSAMLNCNKNYQQITQERKPTTKERKLKNVTPKKKKFVQLEFNFGENNGY